MSQFGTHGESLLCDRYRELYWEQETLQVIATPVALAQAAARQATMTKIVNLLGYTPAA
jgi:hypothetical protein